MFANETLCSSDRELMYKKNLEHAMLVCIRAKHDKVNIYVESLSSLSKLNDEGSLEFCFKFKKNFMETFLRF